MRKNVYIEIEGILGREGKFAMNSMVKLVSQLLSQKDHDHEILVNTILENKNEEIKKERREIIHIIRLWTKGKIITKDNLRYLLNELERIEKKGNELVDVVNISAKLVRASRKKQHSEEQKHMVKKDNFLQKIANGWSTPE